VRLVPFQRPVDAWCRNLVYQPLCNPDDSARPPAWIAKKAIRRWMRRLCTWDEARVKDGIPVIQEIQHMMTCLPAGFFVTGDGKGVVRKCHVCPCPFCHYRKVASLAIKANLPQWPDLHQLLVWQELPVDLADNADLLSDSRRVKRKLLVRLEEDGARGFLLPQVIPASRYDENLAVFAFVVLGDRPLIEVAEDVNLGLWKYLGYGVKDKLPSGITYSTRWLDVHYLWITCAKLWITGTRPSVFGPV